jgi:hypothetical protein
MTTVRLVVLGAFASVLGMLLLLVMHLLHVI